MIESSIEGWLFYKGCIFSFRHNLNSYNYWLWANMGTDRALQRTPEKFRTDELCDVALKRSPFSLRYIPEHLRTYERCKIAFLRLTQEEILPFIPENILSELKMEFTIYKSCIDDRLCVKQRLKEFPDIGLDHDSR
jgi:hypothetical protein